MINALINALALAPAAATTGPSQHIQDLNSILNQVEKFYGQGWSSLEASNELMVTVIAGTLGIIMPILIGLFEFARFRNEIATVQTEAREQIATAKAEAHELTKTARAEASKQTNAATTALNQKIESHIAEAVDGLTTAINAAMENMKNFSAAIACLFKAIANIEQFDKTGDRACLLTAIKMYFLASYHFLLANASDEAEEAKQQAFKNISKIESIEVPILQKVFTSLKLATPVLEQIQKHLDEVLAAIQQRAA